MLKYFYQYKNKILLKQKSMNNQNTNTDILELFEESQQKDILKTEISASLSIEDDIFWDISDFNQNMNSDFSPIETQNTDILSEIEIPTQNIQNTFLEELENLQIESKKKISTGKKVFSGFLFFIKYIGTSSFIFAFLIASTNYNAYIEIARSYLNPEALEQNKQAMLASVQSATLAKTTPQKEEIEVLPEEELNTQDTTQKIEMVKNKTYHSMDKLMNLSKNSIDMNIEIVPYENRIVIPKIWKNIPLLDVQNKTVENVKALEDIFMQELVNGIVRYPGSARPGENGNSFIFWHSSNFPWLEWKYNDVFALMDNLSFWDEIIVYYGQKKYIYQVKEKKIIKPGDTSVLKRNNNIAEISLMTCWPVGTTLNRMVVVWELVKE